MGRFHSILIANRGEIACRVIRTAKALGYRTVAVYSEADAGAPHVRMADEAALLGPGPAAESYLDPERIFAAIEATGADAVHPGYGFLSENAAFARACEHRGVTFIGPTAEAISLMGDKAAAKRRMIEAGVPCVPGYEGVDQAEATLLGAAADIGFPLMVKAAAGGGGRGMRLVTEKAALATALSAARSEAENAFGSGDLILERAIMRPRHVEIQVFADTLGNVIHLGERDCSVQRRHQKVIEEAPSPAVTPEIRAAMGAAAVEAAKSIGYRGAGTVEFLLDQDGAFYFLEMNTRLQVEHPVTEMVTGLDLVAWQIRVAEGEALPLAQDAVSLVGHSIEARLYAEDPSKDFLPATGSLSLWEPAEGDGVRVDSGVASGSEISPFYDPMIAKLVTWGETREIARQRMVRALEETALFGLTTNRAFLIDTLSKQSFADGEATTAFIAEEFGEGALAAPSPSAAQAGMAAVLMFLAERDAASAASLGMPAELLEWSNSADAQVQHYQFEIGEGELDVTVAPEAGAYRVSVGGERLAIAALERAGSRAVLSVDGKRRRLQHFHPGPGRIEIAEKGVRFELANRLAIAASAAGKEASGSVTAPMHGSVLEVFVKPGDTVSIGDRLAVLEAMKMQHEILAEIDGTVADVLAAAKSQVSAGDLMIEIAAAD